MKKEWLPATLLTLVCLIIINGGYTAVVLGMAQLTPQKGLGERIKAGNGQEYYTNVAQKFTADRYFGGRPSAVDYNAAGSGGSNKGPSNPDYLNLVTERIDSFLAHNPGINRASIPSELVTASGSGLDPDISMEAAMIQVPRVARARGVSAAIVRRIITGLAAKATVTPGPKTVNVLRLNLALDEARR
jgi:K+-transporting ATPase ATPase C chain